MNFVISGHYTWEKRELLSSITRFLVVGINHGWPAQLVCQCADMGRNFPHESPACLRTGMWARFPTTALTARRSWCQKSRRVNWAIQGVTSERPADRDTCMSGDRREEVRCDLLLYFPPQDTPRSFV